jgi:hypothetical protein
MAAIIVGVSAYYISHRHQTPEQEACSNCPSTVVLSYEEFGPQSDSYELIGYGWNQWKSEGHELPDDVPIKVVVYRGLDLDTVKRRYPTARGKSDYRFVEYRSALEFLEKKIKEAEEYRTNEKDPTILKLWNDLITTWSHSRSTIIENLGK